MPEYLLWAEQQIAGGAMLVSREAVVEVGRVITGAQFYYHSCGQVFQAAVALASAGTEPTVPAVAYLMDAEGTLDDVGGAPALVDMTWTAMDFATRGCMLANAGVVAEWAARRAVVAEAQESVREAFTGRRRLAIVPRHLRTDHNDLEAV
jgi:replicative DNA helicase